MRKNKYTRAGRIAGAVLLLIGIMSVVFGFGFAERNVPLYLADEIVGAIFILAGMTPWIRYFQDRKANRDTAYDSGNAGRSYSDGSGQAGNTQDFRPTSGWVMADVTGIAKNLRGSDRDQVEYYVMCRYYDGISHSYHTFTSRALKNYPGKDIIGKRVKVIFHSSDPNDYTVDLDSVQ